MSGTFSSPEYSHLYVKPSKNDFEEVIDALMVEVHSDDAEIKDYIKSLPKDKKRIAILSLVGDNNVLWSKINEMLKTEKSSYKRLQGVYFLLRDYVKIAKVNAKSYGEVLTPFKELAEPMVKLVDRYAADFWRNPNHKVLDSSAGYGTFLILAAYKFMVGLKDWEPDEEKRFKWIVENCLYYGELQARSVFSWLVAIDPYDIYETNTYWGSFLDEGFDKHAKEVWKVEKWDLIIQNPPYNIGQNAKGKRGGGDTLWDKFVIKSLSLLKENGYLCFVHPTLWRKPQSERSSSKEVNSIMMKKQIHYLEMHNSEDGMKTFNAGTRYDFYLMENCPIYKSTIINDENRIISEVDLSKYDFIPNKDLEFFDKILAKGDEERCPIIFNRTNYGTDRNYVIETKDDIHKYTLIHSTPKSGTRYMYSSRNDRGHFGIPKVIFGDSGIYDAIIDINGDHGMTQHSMAIKVDSLIDGENIKKVLKSKEFSKFLESVMWSNFQIDWRLFSYIKKDFWKEFMI